jgi:hypothetical protein
MTRMEASPTTSRHPLGLRTTHPSRSDEGPVLYVADTALLTDVASTNEKADPTLESALFVTLMAERTGLYVRIVYFLNGLSVYD